MRQSERTPRTLFYGLPALHSLSGELAVKRAAGVCCAVLQDRQQLLLTLLTTGYEGKTLEAFLNQLLRERVTLLCDVRRNPVSRKYGFAKSTLANACKNVGIQYEHLPELGIASEERRNLRTQADYDALLAKYERRYLPRQLAVLLRVAGWIRDGQRVALVCYELLPEQCHRHCVAEALAARIGKSLRVRHLEEACCTSAC